MRITEVTIIIGVLWLIEIFNESTGQQLSSWGIYPRSVDGLAGILVWPYLHASASHLMTNTIPVAVLSWFVLLRGFKEFVFVTLGISIIAGVAIWVFARPAIHVGASGLIFGYFGFLVAIGWYESSLKSFLFAIVTIFLYGGIVWGILPQSSHVSWEAHLFGLLAGIYIARYKHRPKERVD